jgi:hypothetical protein
MCTGNGTDPLPQSPSSDDTPWGVCRVGGHTGSSNHKVWIVDSGIDDSKYLNIDWDDAAYCADSSAHCTIHPSHADLVDNLHHGTMIAGIIAAHPSGGKGIYGIAPGATVVPVKIFDQSADTTWPIVIKGLAYVANNAKSGDVVNISWGGLWDWEKDPYDVAGAAVRAMADKGVKVVIAAGNFDLTNMAELGGGWVNVISPARAGSYISSIVQSDGTRGVVLTVSASDSTDTFWYERHDYSDSQHSVRRGSFFGNGATGGGPPDYAEPGVGITSLWGGDYSNTCTGTSFAAPHLAGILLKGDPVVPQQPHDCGLTPDPSTRAKNDLDDKVWNPVNGIVIDPSKDDPIAECCK